MIPLSEYHQGEILTKESFPLSEYHQGEILTKESFPLSEYHQRKKNLGQSDLNHSDLVKSYIEALAHITELVICWKFD